MGFAGSCFAQGSLQIRCVHFNHLKKTTLEAGEVLEYKLKGEHHFRKSEIIKLADSCVYLANKEHVRLNQIKAVRFHRQSHLYNLFSKFFAGCGIGFLLIDTSNNFLFNREPKVNEVSAKVCAALLVPALLLKKLAVKQVRINNNNSLKIIDAAYFDFH